MIDTLFNKVISFISFIIKSHDGCNPEFFENRNIVIRRKSSILG